MPWVVDSCVILDIAMDDPAFGRRSAECAEEHLADGMVACPVSVIEVVPEFGGDIASVRDFLHGCGIESREPWTEADTENAAAGWAAYVLLKRRGQGPKRPLADILIGGFACRFQGIITRNGDHFRPYFPSLILVEP